jgi:hypothetical protein
MDAQSSDYGSEGWGFESLRARKTRLASIEGERQVQWAAARSPTRRRLFNAPFAQRSPVPDRKARARSCANELRLDARCEERDAVALQVGERVAAAVEGHVERLSWTEHFQTRACRPVDITRDKS